MTNQRRQARLRALNGALRRMFTGFSGRPTPDRLRSLVDQLDDNEAQDAAPPRKTAG